MTGTVDRSATDEGIPPLEIDMTYGGVYAGSSFEFSPALAAHVNAVAARASGLEEGEFREFAAGEAFSIACPVQAVPRAQFIAAYGWLRAVIDGAVEIRLADHPHLFASPADDPALVRGNPTYIPRSVVPPDFFGRSHVLELYQGDARIFGPAERFFHTSSSGAVFNQIEDGHGRLVLEVRGDLGVLARHGEIVFFTDPVFGLPTAVTQLDDDGSSRALEWHMLGRDRIGDATLFDEWVAVGVAPRGERVVLEVRLPNRGTGLAAALYSGHTRDTAFRADATVL